MTSQVWEYVGQARLKDYRYSPLPPGHIRLVTDIQYDANHNVSVGLMQFPLEDGPSFIALSYTWGNPTKIFRDDDEESRQEKISLSAARDVQITIDGQRLVVTRNLVAYLEAQMQSSLADEQPVPIWIDAICINQGDTLEKNIQVKQMHDIYRKASFVRAWLGPAEDDTSYAIEFMGRIDAVPESSWELIDNEMDLERAVGSIIRSQEHWQATIRFFQRNWFQRCWVVQEAVLARDMEVMVGAVRFDFRVIPRTAMLLTRFSTAPVSDHVIIHSLWSDLNSSAMRDRKVLLLGDVLNWFRCFKASEPRDKVYGAFGWAKVFCKTDAGQELVIAAETLPIDYGLSVEETYTRVVHHIFTRDRNLSLLLCPSSKHRRQGLPSWVPDFSQPAQRRDFAWEARYGSGATRSSEPYPSSNIDPTLLDVGGTHIGDITHAISVLGVNVRTPKEKRQIRDLRLARTVLHIIGLGTNYKDGQNPLDVAWSVLRGFREISGRPPLALRREALVQYAERKLLTAAGSLLDTRSQSVFDYCVASMNRIAEKTGGEVFSPQRAEVLKSNTLSRIPANWVCDLLEQEEKNLSGMFFGTDSKHAGWGAEQTIQPGDSVWLIEGLNIPLILSPAGNDLYRTKGPCFVAGIMEGEVYTKEGAKLITLA